MATAQPVLARQEQEVGNHAAPRLRRADATTALLKRAASAASETERQRLLDKAVLLNIGVAKAVASRYRGRGVPQEDLDQVALLGLVKAVHRFDPRRADNLLAYAVPTIRGEVRKHFRDHGWTVRPPRRVQELQARITTANEHLCHAFGRSPRPSEVASFLGETLDEVTDALATDGCFAPASLDRHVLDDSETTLGDLLPADDNDGEAMEARLMLGPAVRALGDRDRRILHLRFFLGWTQEEIAQDIGVTQMQVSRLLTRILTQLRKELSAPGR
jgi:RNA polymerase sigma-B factor